MVGVAVVIFIAALMFGSFNGNKNAEQEDVSYEFSKARIGDIEIVVSGVGQVQATQQVNLKAVAAGDAVDVVDVHVTNNQEVQKGQLLVSLDSREASRRVNAAQLSLNSALIKQKQVEDIHYKETIDDKWERQLQEISIKERQSSLDQARESLADYYIKAPLDGVITDLVVSTGDSISRTDIIASVITAENKVVVSLNEVDALNVKIGNTAKLTFDALQGVELSGKVSRVDTIGEINQNVVSFDIEIAFDEANEKLRPGMSANAEVTAQNIENVLIVPNGAVKGFGDDAYVERMVNGEVVKTPIKIGISNNFYTQIIEGLSGGAEVITNTVLSQAEDDSGNESTSLFGNMRIPGGGGR